MTDREVLHTVKKIAQIRKTQCWLCKKIEAAIDEITMELIRRKRTVDGGIKEDINQEMWNPYGTPCSWCDEE